MVGIAEASPTLGVAAASWPIGRALLAVIRRGGPQPPARTVAAMEPAITPTLSER